MRDLVAAAAAGLAVAMMACPASGVSGFSQTGSGASDIAWNCAVTRDKSPEQIISFCTRAINSNVAHNAPWAYFVRAMAYDRIGQFASTLGDLNMAVKLSSQSDHNLPFFYNNRCYTRAKLGTDLQSALADCNKALALRPGDPYLLDSRAFVEYRAGDYRAAISDSDAALLGKASLVSSLYVRGLAKLKTGDAANGNEDISAANRRDPSVAAQFASFGISQ